MPEPARSGPVVVLVGPPGAGKTVVGQELAGRLGVGFRDTDADIEAQTESLITELFVGIGEQSFRELEREAVRAALAGHDGVLALGGGAVLDPGTRELLAGNRVVYLSVNAPTAAERVGMARSRPLLLGNVRGQLRALLEARRPIYESVATLTVDTEGATPADVAQAIEAALAGPGPAGPAVAGPLLAGPA